VCDRNESCSREGKAVLERDGGINYKLEGKGVSSRVCSGHRRNSSQGSRENRILSRFGLSLLKKLGIRGVIAERAVSPVVIPGRAAGWRRASSSFLV